MKLIPFVVVLLAAGCDSVNVGSSLPVPGPVKPAVGLNFSKTGVKGTAGVGTNVGPVGIGASGSTKEIKYRNDSSKTRTK